MQIIAFYALSQKGQILTPSSRFFILGVLLWRNHCVHTGIRVSTSVSKYKFETWSLNSGDHVFESRHVYLKKGCAHIGEWWVMFSGTLSSEIIALGLLGLICVGYVLLASRNPSSIILWPIIKPTS